MIQELSVTPYDTRNTIRLVEATYLCGPKLGLSTLDWYTHTPTRTSNGGLPSLHIRARISINGYSRIDIHGWISMDG